MSVAVADKIEVAKSSSNEVRLELGERTLNAQDRCDKCGIGSPAYVRVWKAPYLNDLLFCNHHYKKYAKALEEAGFIVDDQSAVLYKNTKPMSGSNMAD